mgnify:FL=1
MIKVFKLNKKLLLIIILIIGYIVFANYDYAKNANADSYKTPVILIDAGHGHPDGGAISDFSSVCESDLNLEYALTLKQFFNSLNYKVKLTRSTKHAIAKTKTEDMEKRKKIIEKSNCDIFISIHMNRFSLSSSLGAQVFYKLEDENSKSLAENVKNLFVKNLEFSRKLALEGDFMVLNSANCPAILIECGFLSNKLDETRLRSKDYRENLCYQIFCGTIKYLNKEK